MIPFDHYEQSAAYLREKLGDFQPDILMILGSRMAGLIIFQPFIEDYYQ